MFDKETFLSQDVDPETCGDPHCGHSFYSHGRPYGANSNVRCHEEACNCKHRDFIPKPIDAPASTAPPNLKERQAINRNRNLDRDVRYIHPHQRQRRTA